jgi:hypothetical protein
VKKIFTLLFFLLLLAGSAIHPDVASVYGRPAPAAEFDIYSGAASGQAITVNNSEPRFRIFPNPATDFIRVEWQSGLDIEFHAELYDLRGARVAQAKAEESENHIRIDIQSLQRSAYLLKIFTPDGKFSKTYRIVKH